MQKIFFLQISALVDGYCPGYYCGVVALHSSSSLAFGFFMDTTST